MIWCAIAADAGLHVVTHSVMHSKQASCCIFGLWPWRRIEEKGDPWSGRKDRENLVGMAILLSTHCLSRFLSCGHWLYFLSISVFSRSLSLSLSVCISRALLSSSWDACEEKLAVVLARVKEVQERVAELEAPPLLPKT